MPLDKVFAIKKANIEGEQPPAEQPRAPLKRGFMKNKKLSQDEFEELVSESMEDMGLEERFEEDFYTDPDEQDHHYD